MAIEEAAKKEMDRMKAVMASIKVIDPKNEKASEFLDFAKNYSSDSGYFYEKKQFVEAFEAAVIAWAYVDVGLKLGFFSVPAEQKKWFTSE